MTSSTFRAIIIDDERHCIETLRYELSGNCPEIELLSAHQDALEGIKAINDSKPDIVFLDIELNEVSGFQFLKNLSYRSFQLIFTTAYNQYAIDALKVKAFDYLMKPVSGKELRECIDRLIKERNDQETVIAKVQSDMPENFFLPVGNSSVFIKPHEIIRAQADGNFSIIFLQDQQEHYVSKSLKEIEQILSPPLFLRIHKSHMVNVKKIKAHHKAEGGSIEMSDGAQLPITKTSIDEILTIINLAS